MGFRVYNFLQVFNLLHVNEGTIDVDAYLPYLFAYYSKNNFHFILSPTELRMVGSVNDEAPEGILIIPTGPIQLDMITPYINIYTIPPFLTMSEQEYRLTFTLPMFQLQMSGEVHTPIHTDLEFTIPEIELDLWFGSYLGINVPTISLLLSGLETLRVRTLPPSISMEGTVSIRGRCEIDFTLPEINLQAIPIVNSSLSLTLPRLLASFGSNLALGNLSVRTPTLSLNAVQTFIETAILSLEVPLSQFNIQSSFDVIHSILNINIPLPYLLLIAYLEEILSDKVLVLNTVNTALSEYTNMPFAGAFRLGSKLYVCSSDGLYELSSNTDDGSNIEASASLPLIDMFSERVKRIAHVYLTLRGEGGKIIINDKYTYRFSGASRLDERRVKIGKGIKDRFIKITLANERGSVFAVDTMTIFADRETKRER